MDANLDLSEIREMYSQIKLSTYKADEKFKEIRQKILKGETTGDNITDFVIVNHHQISKEKEEPYRQLEKRLKEYVGQNVLVINMQEHISGCPGIVAPPFIDPMFLDVRTTYKLGKLNSGVQFDIPSANIVLPMERHVIYSDGFHDRTWKVGENGNIMIYYLALEDIGKAVGKRIDSMKNDGSERLQHGIEIYAGEDVKRHFAYTKYPEEFYQEALDLLKR